MVDQRNLIDLIITFQIRVHQHDIEKIMSMFTEDATFEIVGLSKFSEKQQVKTIFEYDIGVNTHLQFINFKVEGNTVHCKILERNDRLDAIGISELEFSSCIITFKDQLIKSFTAEVPPDFVEHNIAILKKFIPWLTENHPNDYSRMFTPEGRFIYNYENGRDVVPLLRKWSIEQEADS